MFFLFFVICGSLLGRSFVVIRRRSVSKRTKEAAARPARVHVDSVGALVWHAPQPRSYSWKHIANVEKKIQRDKKMGAHCLAPMIDQYFVLEKEVEGKASERERERKRKKKKERKETKKRGEREEREEKRDTYSRWPAWATRCRYCCQWGWFGRRRRWSRWPSSRPLTSGEVCVFLYVFFLRQSASSFKYSTQSHLDRNNSSRNSSQQQLTATAHSNSRRAHILFSDGFSVHEPAPLEMSRSTYTPKLWQSWQIAQCSFLNSAHPITSKKCSR